MENGRKKNARERNIDRLAVAEATTELAFAATEYVDALLELELRPEQVDIGKYNTLIDASTKLDNLKKRQLCQLVVPAWPRTEDGGYLFDNMTLEIAYK